MDCLSPSTTPPRNRRKKRTLSSDSEFSNASPQPNSRAYASGVRSSHGKSPLSGAERTRGARSPYVQRARNIDEARRQKHHEGKDKSRARHRSPLKESQNNIRMETGLCHPEVDCQTVTCGSSSSLVASVETGSQNASASHAGLPSARPKHANQVNDTLGDATQPTATHGDTFTAQSMLTFDCRPKYEQLLGLRMTKPEQELTTVQRQFSNHVEASTNLIGALRRELKQCEAERSIARDECHSLQARVKKSESSFADLRTYNAELSATADDLQSQLDLVREQLAAEQDARQLYETQALQELQAVRESEEDCRDQLSTANAQVEDLQIQVEALREHIAKRADSMSTEEMSSMQCIIDCYSRMTGFSVQVDPQRWQDDTEAFRCFFTDAVGMEGHGFTLLHHLDCGEVEYSPEVYTNSETPRKSRKRRSIGRAKISTLPEHLREGILFDNDRGSPRFTFLMLQALIDQLKKSPT